MPEEIVSRMLRLPGYGISGWDTDEVATTLILSIRQTAGEPYYVCGGCGISVREIHSWTERRIRDLPWGTWTVWLRGEGPRVRCRRCAVRTERRPFVEGKVHYTARLEAAVAQDYEAAPVSRVAAQRSLPPETVRRMDKRVRRCWAECFRQGAEARGLIRGKCWRLRRRWANLDWEERQPLRDLFPLNRWLAKASLLTEQRAQLWAYTDEGAARRCLTNWLLALRWQRLPAFQTLGRMLTRHLDGILSYCHETVPFGTVDAINGNTVRCCVGAGATGTTSTSSSRSRRPPPRVASVTPHEH